MAKLAIADSFYLEGGTSSLIQAGQAYQDWLAERAATISKNCAV